MAKETVLNSVEEVIEDFRIGKPVIVVDDEDRENEGDFIVAAEKITPEIVNFMLKEGRGVLCAPLSEKRCAELGLNMMEENNTSLLGTPFTVTVDLLGHDCTTGVSIHDRAATIRALAEKIIALTGSRSHIVHTEARIDDIRRRTPDISATRRELDWAPRTPLVEGLRRTISYVEKELADKNYAGISWVEIN